MCTGKIPRMAISPPEESMEKEKVFEIIEQSPYLPVLPEDVCQILNSLKNPIDADIDKVIDIVSKSEELNSILLKYLNSGYFEFSKEIKSIKEAVVFLGMQAVQNLLIFFITLQFFPRTMNKSDRVFDMQRYWKHVLGTAVAGRLLAKQINKGNPYKLFTYGLMHDIGIIMIDACLPSVMDTIAKKLLSGTHQLIAERSVLGGLTHADLGAWLCRKWNIREDIITIVQFHHTPFMVKENTEEVLLMYVADVISTQYYQRLLGINPNHEITHKVMEKVGVTKDDLQAIIDAFPEELEKVSHYFSWY